MNDPEKHLRDLRLAPPSADLDRRMDDAFAAAADANPIWRRRWWWLTALPLGTAATFLFLLLRPVPEPPPSPARAVVYEIEPQGLMRDLLLTPPTRLRAPPKLSVDTPR